MTVHTHVYVYTWLVYHHIHCWKKTIKECKHGRIDTCSYVAQSGIIAYPTRVANKKGIETSIKKTKLMSEVGVEVHKSIYKQGSRVHPYYFSLKYHNLKSSRDVTCMYLY